MKIYNIHDIEKFCDVIDHCKGKISLIVGNGDRFNLKSKLSQYIALTQYFGAATIPEIEIHAEDPEDVVRLTNYLISA